MRSTVICMFDNHFEFDSFRCKFKVIHHCLLCLVSPNFLFLLAGDSVMASCLYSYTHSLRSDSNYSVIKHLSGWISKIGLHLFLHVFSFNSMKMALDLHV